mmetsp:Transcript_55569/g.146606  ORF Transcript_55569/g.146606 Transcript_55569/m.146606 type:complete len:81 (-) Transcript_55569:797-1039(-)
MHAKQLQNNFMRSHGYSSCAFYLISIVGNKFLSKGDRGPYPSRPASGQHETCRGWELFGGLSLFNGFQVQGWSVSVCTCL